MFLESRNTFTTYKGIRQLSLHVYKPTTLLVFKWTITRYFVSWSWEVIIFYELKQDVGKIALTTGWYRRTVSCLSLKSYFSISPYFLVHKSDIHARTKSNLWKKKSKIDVDTIHVWGIKANKVKYLQIRHGFRKCKITCIFLATMSM